MAVRVRAWLLACATLLILLLPIAVAGTALATVERGQGALVAEVPQEAVVAASPLQSASVTRQAYDLLLDNFVSPPPPATLLESAAIHVGKLAAARKPGEWPAPTIAADASRDEAWVAFDAWLGRVAMLLAPVVDRTALDEIAMRALASAMDEHHTRYLDPRQNEEHQAWRRGEVRYEGIGARLRRPTTVVLEVFEGGPAANAGLRTGDRILAIDGESVDGSSSEAAIGRIRGPLGSSIVLTVERRGTPSPLQITVQRAEIKLPFVRWDVLQRADGRRIGYLQIRGFPEPSVDDRVGEALAALDRRGIDGLVLDLRGNSGGRIDVGMKVVSRFVREGIAFQQLDRSGRERLVRPTGAYWERSFPIVALVDGGTASMGEILSSALQEAGEAKIVGTQTAGGVAGARLFPLANGGALQITVLTIRSGSGKVLNDVGVTPDDVVDLSDEDLQNGIDVQLEAGASPDDVAPAGWPHLAPAPDRARRGGVSDPADAVIESLESQRHIVLAQVMLPADANPSGDVHGGTLMKLADTAGGIAAVRHARRRVVTAIADSMTFEHPVKVGDLVLLDAQVSWVGRSSVEVEVAIYAEKVVTGIRRRTSLAYFVFVALGEDGRPHEVPSLEIRTEAERVRFARAEERRRFRLAQRGHQSS